jgi:hypothetical protein
MRAALVGLRRDNVPTAQAAQGQLTRGQPHVLAMAFIPTIRASHEWGHLVYYVLVLLGGRSFNGGDPLLARCALTSGHHTMRTRGFTFTFICFPLREWDNWRLERSFGLLSVGPLRFRLAPEKINR